MRRFSLFISSPSYTYLVTGEMKDILQPGTFSSTLLAGFGYDNLGRRTSISRANGASTTYSYDPVSRLSQLVQNPAGTTNDVTLGFTYNPASQVTSSTRSNNAYSWTGHGNGTTNSSTNGLNQIFSQGGASINHDAKGNSINDPTIGYTYGYSSENLLNTVSNGSWTGTLLYDPLTRLYESGANGRSRFVYDGEDRIAEYYSTGAQTYRFVHGPGVDEPLIQYSGTNLATRQFLHADERGSIIATSDDAGTVTSVGRYDEYGKTQTSTSRFGYTGQPYETMSELYYYRARMFNPRGPRFMQADPIGYGSGMNMYAYVKGDPVNFTDPLGLESMQDCKAAQTASADPIVCGQRYSGPSHYEFAGGFFRERPVGRGKGATRKPFICKDVSRDGNDVDVNAAIEFYYGDYPITTPSTKTPSASAQDGLTYLSMMNNWWTGDFGKFSVTTNLRLGAGGLIAFIGNTSAGGTAELGGRVMWLRPPPYGLAGPYMAAAGRLAGHELGHIFGIAHPPQGVDSGLMNAGAGGNPQEAHVAALLQACGLEAEGD